MTLILHHWLTSVHKSATKSVLQVQVAYCSKLLLDSTGNALEKDKLIQQTQQKEMLLSATLNSPRLHWEQLLQTQMAAYKLARPSPQRSTNHCIYSLALDRIQTLFSSQTTGSLHTSDSDGFSFSKNFFKMKVANNLGCS